MAKISFNVDAYTARLIGRENVAKLNGAVLELVKNTYDADASVCIIYYDNVNENLYIGDNGCGMSKEIIQQHWMTIGRSSKKTTYVTNLGRVQTGAKGIGRFALDRIADKCEMITASGAGRYLWKVDWRNFDYEKAITDVQADLDITEISFENFVGNTANLLVKKLIAANFSKQGTIFKLSLLRDEWDSKQIQNLKVELMTLIPSELSNIYNIYLLDNSTSMEEAAVLHNNELFSYDYKVEFDVSSDGVAKISLSRNEFDFGKKFEDIMRKASFSAEDRTYFTGTPIETDTTFSELITKEKHLIANTVGAFHGVLYFFKQTTSVKEKQYYYKDISARKHLKKTFGGIKIYRDNFRVRPYGDVGSSNYDWLQLNDRQNSSPASISHPSGAWKVSASQMLGSLYISRTNITLPDQANREGIVETREFLLLKQFLIGVIHRIEIDRHYVCRKLADLHEKESAEEAIRKEIEEKARQAAAAKEEASTATQATDTPSKDEAPPPSSAYMVEASKAQLVISARDSMIKELEDENRLLRVLATTGIVTNTYIHEFRDQTHRLGMSIVSAIEALEYDSDIPSAQAHLLEADTIRTAFNSWFRVTIDSVRRDKRRMKVVDIHEIVREASKAWLQVIESKGINIRWELQEEVVSFKCFPFEIEILLSNLITNSVAAFATIQKDDKEIVIKVGIQENTICIGYADNGPGLTSAYINNPEAILKPFETSKVDKNGEPIGTGMGMWVVNRTVSDYNGWIDLSGNNVDTVGFNAKIFLPG